MAACEGASNERVVQYILDSFSGDHAAFEKYINLRDNVRTSQFLLFLLVLCSKAILRLCSLHLQTE